jgi:hypothetical protein
MEFNIYKKMNNLFINIKMEENNIWNIIYAPTDKPNEFRKIIFEPFWMLIKMILKKVSSQ